MIRLATNPNCKFSIGFHASQHGQLQNLYGDDYMAIYNEVKGDIFFANSVNERDENRAGGLVNEILGADRFNAKDYDQAHGWVVRGNISDPAVKVDVDDAIQLALQFALDHK